MSAPPIKVLVVDDDPAVIELLREDQNLRCVGARHHHHAMPGEVHPPAEIDVLA